MIYVMLSIKSFSYELNNLILLFCSKPQMHLEEAVLVKSYSGSKGQGKIIMDYDCFLGGGQGPLASLDQTI